MYPLFSASYAILSLYIFRKDDQANMFVCIHYFYLFMVLYIP
jgi:hypothetical protein